MWITPYWDHQFPLLFLIPGQDIVLPEVFGSGWPCLLQLSPWWGLGPLLVLVLSCFSCTQFVFMVSFYCQLPLKKSWSKKKNTISAEVENGESYIPLKNYSHGFFWTRPGIPMAPPPACKNYLMPWLPPQIPWVHAQERTLQSPFQEGTLISEVSLHPSMLSFPTGCHWWHFCIFLVNECEPLGTRKNLLVYFTM